MDDSEWIELTASIEEEVLLSMLRAVIKEEAGVKKQKSDLDRLADERANLKCSKSSLLI